MKEAVIDSEENLGRIYDAREAGGGWQIAAISNVRVVEGAVRVTMLPNSAFLPESPKTPKETWLKIFRETVTKPTPTEERK